MTPGGGLGSLAQSCLVSCVSQAVLPGILTTAFLAMGSGLSALPQSSSIWGMIATGYLCFW